MTLVEAYAGEIRLFAGDFAPRGWALCDGQRLSIDRFPVLFAIFGTTYGGDGIHNFALPDLRGRMPVHPAHNECVPGRVCTGAAVATGTDAQLTSTLSLNYIICLQGVYPDRS